MFNMARWIVAAMILGLLVGCQQNQKIAREEAYKRWYRARASVLCGLANQNLNVGNLEGAAKAAREASNIDKDSPEALQVLGKVFIEQGEYAQAVVELRRVVELSPQSFDARYLLGTALEKSGNLEEAFACYRQAGEMDKTSVDALLAIGEVLAEMDRVEEAQVFIESNLNAGGTTAMNELAGRLAMMRNEFEKAQRYYQAAHDLDGMNACYLDALGRAQFLSRRYSQAAETFKQLSETVGYQDKAWVWIMLGDSLLAAKRPDSACEAFRKANELDAESHPAWIGLAKSSLSMGDVHRSALAAREAMKLDERNADAAVILGYALIKQGKGAQAAEMLAVVAGAHPSSGMIQNLLGRAYAMSGRRAEAIRCYQLALKLEPRDPLAREFLRLNMGQDIP